MDHPGHDPAHSPLLFGMEWTEVPPFPSAAPPSRRVVVCSEALGSAVEAASGAGAVRVVHLPTARPADPAAARIRGAGQVLKVVQEALADATDEGAFLQFVFGGDEAEIDLAFAAAALLRTAEAESARLRGQVLMVAGLPPETLAVRLAVEAGCPADRLVRIEGGRRTVRRPISLAVPDAARPWRDGGTYLITGGQGRLGLAFARDIVSHATAPTLILAGRSALGETARTTLAQLEGFGARVVHHVTDIVDAWAVDALVAWIRGNFGMLNGVLHAAGIIRDGFLQTKTDAEVEAVLAPKIGGALALDEATADHPLDFFACFSSLAGITGNPGQADYAMANALVDAFAVRRAAQVEAGSRTGRSLSVNWPLWVDGGMQVDDAVRTQLHRDHGLVPLSTADGLLSFARALSTGQPQVAVACGDPQRVLAHLAGPAADPADRKAPPAAPATPFRPAVIERLREVVAEITGRPKTQIDALELLEFYGIDSIMITTLNERLGRVFGKLPKALVFEHRTLDGLAGYLVQHHPDACVAWAGERMAAAPAPVRASAPAPLHRSNVQPGEPIAVIGMSGRFPQAPDLQGFWRNLVAGADCITEIPADRWPLAGFFEPDRQKAVDEGKSYSKWGGFLGDFADFDPLFFGISPREALAMDPQERLFLETAWETMEDAAVSPETLSRRYGGRVGVFAGVTKTGFDLYRMSAGGRAAPARTSFASVANRVSYVLDLSGPSVPVDTMCSSSLTAVHQACQSLRQGECDLALAGGVNLYLHPTSYVDLCASGMLAEDGRCRSFGRGGTGFVPGEGVGCVMLAPLSLARSEGLRILAVIGGSAVNHGGHTLGYTAPSPTRQRDVIRAALDSARVDARSVSYVEAHGTGTALGDPIEIEGLTAAFRQDTPDRGYCAIASVKSSIGHLEAAAGIAGLIKTILQLRHGRLTPSLHADEVNPNLDLESSPFALQRGETPWTAAAGPRRAIVSSFGAGGANACVLVEEWVDDTDEPGHHAAGPQAILLSARSTAELTAAARRLRQWIAAGGAVPEGADARGLEQAVVAAVAETFGLPAEDVDGVTPFADYGLDATDRRRLSAALASRYAPGADPNRLASAGCVRELAAWLGASGAAGGATLDALAWTLQSGRKEMEHRLGFKCASLAELSDALDAFLAGQPGHGRWWLGRVDGSRESRCALSENPAIAQTMARLAAARDLDRLIPLWTRGLAVEWRATYRSPPPRPLGLPGYPFARRRLWFDDVPKAGIELAPAPTPAPVPLPTPVGEDVREVVRAVLAATLDLRADEIAADTSFADYGLDSILSAGFVGQLNARLGIALDVTVVFDHSTVDRLGRHIASRLPAAPASAPARPVPSRKPAPCPTASPAPVGNDEPIAVIGMSGRFPGAPDVDALWNALALGRDLVTPVERWDLPAQVTCRAGGFLSDIDRFDALFFNISGAEAAYMDPQQRLFLEESWKALEQAGHAGDRIAGSRCGVYVGCYKGDYEDLIGERPSVQSLWGNMASVIPGRIAYFLDLKGPALAIDTSCSSSLVAIHTACRDLRAGEADMALAGGVFIQTTPKLYLAASRAGMLSPTGRCHAFDSRADGFVPGEGVGVLVLKRLSAAQADGDHIHGLILGSGINHDGTTNGITAPSGESQAALLGQVYAQCGVSPEAVGMLEAHGTGTALGDPIEYGALIRTFAKAETAGRSIALGSIKTNIGHGQFAAGVAGAIKVLLALGRRNIPPSLNFDAPNPRIDLRSGPFHVPTAMEPWPAVGNAGRIGAVSAFGASGTNAHVVIAEPPPAAAAAPARLPFLAVLSARSEPALRDLANRLADHCRSHPDLCPADIAFTLAVGRKHLEHRLALIVEDTAELSRALSAWLANPLTVTVQSGTVDGGRRDEREAAFDAASTGEMRRQELSRLAEAFVGGGRLPVDELFAGEARRRLPLPGTAFADTRFWLPGNDARPQTSSGPTTMPGARLRRLPDEDGKRVFAVDLDTERFPMAEHRVQGQPILPGVAVVTLIAEALGDVRNYRIEDLVWARPVTPGAGGLPCRLTLSPDANGTLTCRVELGTEIASTARLRPMTAAVPPHLDLAGLRAECTEEISLPRCQDAIRGMGIEHGPAMRAMRGVRLSGTLAVAELSLPGTSGGSMDAPPALLDSALQAAIAFTLRGPGDATLDAVVPFSIASVTLFAPCQPEMVAVLRVPSAPKGGVFERLDVDLCDRDGTVCVRMQGFMSRRLGQTVGAEPAESETLLLKPVWEPYDVAFPGAIEARRPALVIGADEETLGLLAAVWPDLTPITLDDGDAARRIAAAGDVREVVWIAPRPAAQSHASNEPAVVLESQSLALLRLVGALVEAGAESRALAWTIITEQGRPIAMDDRTVASSAGLHGLFGALAKEYPHWQVRVLDIEAGRPWPIADIARLPAETGGAPLLHRRGAWHRLALIPTQPIADAPSPYRDGAVYVVIGGAGGVGRIWTEAVLRRHRAQVVWIGRRPLDRDIDACLDALAALGPRPLYLQADAVDAGGLTRARDEILARFARIDGLIHSAISLNDRTLARMDEEALRQSLRAKAHSCVGVAQVFDLGRMDFVLFFSSIQSFACMPGQANYAAGSVFADAYARLIARSTGAKVRVMNWGWWADAGAAISDDHKARMGRAGLAGLSVAPAMTALDTLLAGPDDQLALVALRPGGTVTGLNRGESARWASASCPSVLGTALSSVPPQEALIRAVTARVGRQMDEMDAAMARLLWVQMNAAGLFADETYRVADLAGRMAPLYGGDWLLETLRVLARHAYLTEPTDGCGRVIAVPGLRDAAAAWAFFQEQARGITGAAELGAHLRLVEAMLRELPDIVSGRRAATDVMFPQSSLALVESVYRDNPVADYFNEVLCDVLESVVAARLAAEPAAQIRLLEVGAGTGGTAIRAFERLRRFGPSIAEYCYTDLSKAFLLHAERNYRAAAPYLTTRIFDVDQPVADQGGEAAGFDIVIATNVLHATRSIRTSLRNVKAAMKKGGVLLLNELSANVLFSHLTFGLLEGWWKYNDPAIRLSGTPALAPDTWASVLETEGFRRLAFPARPAHVLGQQIVACESDGFLRQRVEAEAPVAAPVAQPAAAPAPAPSAPPAAETGLRDKARQFIRDLVGKTIDVPAAEIRFGERFERYGVDSILVLQIVAKLGEIFAEVSSTLLFEASTVDDLTDHFLATQPDALRRAVGDVQAVVPPPARMTAAVAPRIVSGPAIGRHEVAIVGLSGRYPQAEDLSRFWVNLIEGRDCVGEIPAGRFDWRPHFDERRGQPGKLYSRFGGFIDGVDQFDPLFFHLSPAEAERMDPQERLFLEQSWLAIENAGYNPRALGLHGRVGVFAGVSNAHYATGAAFWSVANRVSFLLDLKGPSMAVDTACSSSLTAVHLAVESIRTGRCDMALAGGVNLIVHPDHMIALSEAAMLSPTGKCRSFGAGADGFADGEGVGVALLRPLEDAVADGDQILAVIVGTAVNSGGRTSSYTAPNPAAQADVVQAAWRDAGIDPRAISYVEAHGTGTALGDPIELEGLTRAFRSSTRDDGFCALGSVKSNIGHLESAAGIAGITKVVLQLRHGMIAPTLHADEPNPHLNFANSPLILQRSAGPWPQEDGRPRLASVSSFGAGGANAHVTLREFVAERAVDRPGTPPSPVLLVLTARTPDLLGQSAAKLAAHLKAWPPGGDAAHLADAAFTLQTGRDAQAERLAITAASREEAVAALEAAARGDTTGGGVFRGAIAGDGLLGDEDFGAVMAAWAAKGELARLAAFWVKGAPVDWQALYPNWTPRRVPLPGSPFARQRYWLDTPAAQSARAPAPLPATLTSASAGQSAVEGMVSLLRNLVSQELKLAADDIDVHTPLENYGLDSLAIIRVTDRLGQAVGEVPTTLFFEHRTLADAARVIARTGSDLVRAAAISAAAEPADSDIAIIGMAGRYPMAEDLEAFWRNLRDGRDCVTEIPAERWDHTPFYSPERKPGTTRSRWGGFLDGVDLFDARFFGMLPEDAELTDPQERLFTECVFRAMEDGGHSPASLSAPRTDLAGADVGVYVGVMSSEYPYFGVAETARGRPTALFGSPASIANRVSYLFGFHGPSMAVDSMCSGSLTALHLACQALLNGDCQVAVAGGVNLSLHPNKYLALGKGGFESANGRCAAFGEGGDGYVPAEGVGAVIIKPLARALADGDRIHGVIKATDLNHGGKTNGFTVPDPTAQSALIERALAKAKVAPRSISYLEAHGTGTALGDPIEIAGLSRAFDKSTADTGFCAIGSVKSNIGHCEGAAGIAGLTKVLLQMRHRELVPSLHADRLNPRIDFAATPFVVQREAAPWRPVDGILRAAVSAFGAGGSNAHVIVEAPPVLPPAAAGQEDGPQIVALSARSAAALSQMVQDLAARVAQGGECFADLAFTLQTGREGNEERLAFVAGSAEQAAEILTALAEGRSLDAPVHRGRTRRGAERAFDGSERMLRPLDEIARRWVAGAPVDWSALHEGQRRRRVGLPPYPLDPQSYWHPACRRAATTMEPASPAQVRPVAPPVEAEETLLLRPFWTEQSVAQAAADAVLPRSILLCGLPAATAEAIRSAVGRTASCQIVGHQAADAGATFTAIATAIVPVAQDLMRERGSGPRLIQLVASLTPSEGIAAGLAGLAGTLAQEAPFLRVQTIVIDPADDPAQCARRLAEDARASADRFIRHSGGRRQVRKLGRVTATISSAPLPWRDGGCYLITGGLGGLGRIFARHVTAEVRQPRLILTGRSQPTAAARTFMAELEQAGARVAYHALDVADAAAVTGLVGAIRAEHGGLSGVLHSAGLLKDSLLLRKTVPDALAVLAPKVTGVVALDDATRAEALDFFACFGSLAGVTGNLGQADYAMANGFLDGFAAWRNRLVGQGARYGRTVSLDWPLWAEGGMTMPPAKADQIREAFGLVALPTANAMAAFAQALAGAESQILVVHGLARRILERIDGGIADPEPESAGPSERAEARPAAKAGTILTILAEIIAADLRVDAAEVPIDQAFGDLGFDSVALGELAARIGKALGTELPHATLFACPTIAELAAHLASNAPALPVSRAPEPVREAPASISRRTVHSEDEPIAIIGVSATFPGSGDMDAFWANLAAERDCISEVPADRWDWRAIWGDPLDEPGRTNVKWGGFIDGMWAFDPRFFGISPREAELMDPQHRLLMTHVWRAIEEAGHAPASLAGSQTSVYLATASSGHSELMALQPREVAARSPTGAAVCIAPNRISYLLDLHGASEPVDTACSSSLVALHRGAESLRRGEAALSIVGGINTILTPTGHLGLSRAGMLSPEGRCKTFTAQADGYVRGEGVCVFVLKPLRDAEVDGDHVHAVVRASGVNHNGRAVSLTAPNPVAQGKLLTDVYRRAGIDPRTITYMEAHGTATAAGDPVEIEGMTEAFRRLHADWGAPAPAAPYCGIGSVKTHIGHLEMAAGAAGLAKVLMQIKHRTLVPNLHISALNPRIDLAGTPFHVVQAPQPWRALRDEAGREIPRRAGISSFGYGGVNAHVLVEEYQAPQDQPRSEGTPPEALLVSARTQGQLAEACRQLLSWLEANGRDHSLADVAYTLQVGRNAMQVRLGLIAATHAEAKAKLARHLAGETAISGLHCGRAGQNRPPTGPAPATADRLEELVRTWVDGEAVDWSGMPRHARRRVSLPTYPFARETYRLGRAAAAERDPAPAAPVLHPLLHRSVGEPTVPCYETHLSGDEPFLRDHVVNGQRVLPAAAFLEMARAAVHHATEGVHGSAIEEVRFERFAAPGEEGLAMDVALTPRPDGVIAFVIGSRNDKGRLIHCRGLSRPDGGTPGAVPERLDLAAMSARMTRGRVSGADCAAAQRQLGLAFGPSHRGLTTVSVGDGEVLAEIRLPADSADTSPKWVMNPALLDAALQSAIGLAVGPDGKFVFGRAEVPVAIDRLAIFGPLPPELRVVVTARRPAGLDLILCAEDGTVCAKLLGFRLFPVKAGEAATPVPLPQTAPAPSTAGPLVRLLAQTIGISVEDVSAQADLSDFGLDVITLTRFAQVVTQEFGVPLSPAEIAAMDSLDGLAQRLDVTVTASGDEFDTYWADVASWAKSTANAA